MKDLNFWKALRKLADKIDALGYWGERRWIMLDPEQRYYAFLGLLMLSVYGWGAVAKMIRKRRGKEYFKGWEDGSKAARTTLERKDKLEKGGAASPGDSSDLMAQSDQQE